MRFIRTISRWTLLPVAVLMLAACQTAPKTITIEKQVPYAVAVATGCIDARGRPAVPASLKSLYTPDQWAALAPGAKAAAVEAQAGRRLNYEELDRAATSGCQVAKPVAK